jgi:hypothetical protein
VSTCPECGNDALATRLVGGATVHECELCGARFGDPEAVARLDDAEQARLRGVPVDVWPLVRTLERLPGLCVRGASAGDEAAGTLPFVELGPSSHDALRSLENLAKSLQLAAPGLRLHWVVELEYRRHLAFVLKPRHGGGAVAAATARHAMADASALARLIERDTRLSWWRHAGGGTVE